MIDPLKRMTAELQKIKQERRFIGRTSHYRVGNDEAALFIKSLKSNRLSTACEANMWEEEQRVLHLKDNRDGEGLCSERRGLMSRFFR
jgi:hypothetical protein